ncbi:MAG TPA: carboxypeptidase regulatory-like domain-containing protein [Bryobacteraceae bacterium]|nr:carboxypeptidase regulatory-like domain-containing protein [Bryobacteraceae bacterium]
MRIHRALLILLAGGGLFAQSGVVKSANQPIPGATVTATIAGKKLETTTDQSGHYAFAGAPAGACSIEVRMFGFEPASKKSDCAENTKLDFALQLQESPAAQRMARMGGAQGAGNQLESQLQGEVNAPEAATPGTPQVDGQNSNEAFQVSGSLSQGLTQNAQPDYGMLFGGPGMLEVPGGQFGGPGGPGGPGGGGAPGGGGPGFGGPGGGFGGPGGGGGRGGGGGFGGPGGRARGQGQNRPGAQFGNRRGPSQIHGMVFMTLANSVVNAKPYSFTGQEVPQPPYASARFGFLVGGPLIIPKIVKDPSTFFYLNYTGTRSRQPYEAVETVPTAQERMGDFSQLLQGTQPTVLYYPGTSTPIAGNQISGMLNPIAVKLLQYIPFQNQPGLVSNYQYFASPPNNSDNFNGRVMRNLNQKDRLAYHLSFQRRDADNAQPFAFFDTVSGYGIQTDLTWTHNFTPTTILSSMVSFNRNRSQTTPFFAYGTDVAAELGIAGASTNPVDYGPPNLNFTNFGSLTDGQPILTRNQSQGDTESAILSRGKHTITIGAGYTRADTSTSTQQNGRGTFNFTGQATSLIGANGLPVAGTGLDFADFLLGMPQSASVQYSPAMYFTQNNWNSFLLDDWKVSANLTLNLGLRWEFFQPVEEKYNEMANLDIAPGFGSVAVVAPTVPGPYSGSFPAGLINPDYRNFSPRIGLAYKVPFIKRSTIIRAGYGIYYNGQSYIPFGLKLAQQPQPPGLPPFAVSASVNTSPQTPVSLASLPLPDQYPSTITNSFAVDRYYHTPYAQTWNFTIQHDLGSGFFMEVGYLGTKGTDLDVLLLPSEGPPGTTFNTGTQLGNATGFTYDVPVGNSSFNVLQTHLMRRLRAGISMNARYNFSKSIDDASSFGGVGATVAQNWLDLAAERGLSSFNRTSVFTLSWVYTSPFGNPNSRYASSGWAGRALRNWTLSGGITAESGTPLTARVLGNGVQLAQTNGVGSERADATGLPLEAGSGFFNLAAFTLPPAGEFGNAGRNTIPGPDLVSVNLAFGRSFQFGDTRRRLEFRAEANNVLNQVNITNVATVVNATNYGLPTAASGMRTLDIVMRFRF